MKPPIYKYEALIRKYKLSLCGYECEDDKNKYDYLVISYLYKKLSDLNVIKDTESRIYEDKYGNTIFETSYGGLYINQEIYNFIKKYNRNKINKFLIILIINELYKENIEYFQIRML